MSEATRWPREGLVAFITPATNEPQSSDPWPIVQISPPLAHLYTPRNFRSTTLLGFVATKYLSASAASSPAKHIRSACFPAAGKRSPCQSPTPTCLHSEHRRAQYTNDSHNHT